MPNDQCPISSRFLAWFCPPELYEGVAGDLAEQYEANLASLGERRARRRYAWGVLRFFRPGIVFRQKFRLQPTGPLMIGNYLKVASRNLYKRKFFTFVNALGLSIGIAMCLLIGLYVEHERSFDRFHSNADRIVRIHERSYSSFGAAQGNPYVSFAYLQAPLPGTLKEEAPEVERVSVFISNEQVLLKVGDVMRRQALFFVDDEFLQMFDFGMVAGDSLTALSDPASVVLTESVAKALFDGDALGKTIATELFGGTEQLLTVTGVVRDVPTNSSLQFEVLVPNALNRNFQAVLSRSMSWENYAYPVFAQLREGASPESFQASLDGIYHRYVSEKKEANRVALGLPDTVVMGRYGFTPLADLHHAYEIGWPGTSNPQYAWILSGLALLVLVIACVNYVTLAVSASAGRAREVGVRKTMGARRGDLIGQFCTESVLVAGLAWAVALGLVVMFLPSFNEFTSRKMDLAGHWVDLLGVSVPVVVLVGLLAGSYPALFVSRLAPIEALKGERGGKLRAFFTKYLVVFQFSLSAFLLISSVAMYSQMRYMTEKDLGFNADMVVAIDLQQGGSVKSEAVTDLLRAELQPYPEVLGVSAVNLTFGGGLHRTSYKVDEESKYTFVYRVDDQYLKTMEIELLHGRNFKPGWRTDTTGTPVIVNEAFARDIGWTDYTRPYEKNLPFEIVGVVRDHHFQSLTHVIEPMRLEPVQRPQRVLVRLQKGSLPYAMDLLRATWAKVEPGKPFSYAFLDDEVAAQYRSYENWTRIMGVSAFFAVLIACLGLFGLAGVNAANRTKEVGIRKVMGAGMADIVVLLNRPFVVMAVVAFVLAVPAAWYAMDQWLANFEYSVALDWWVFAAAFVVSLMLALATVSFHAWRAANLNPVETLKYE